MLGEELRMSDAGTKPDAVGETRDEQSTDASVVEHDADNADMQARDASARPTVSVRVKPIDCGKCFDLQAEGAGGVPPYQFEWEDGSRGPTRRVCVQNAVVALSVVARDAAQARSLTQELRLEGLADAACPQDLPPIAAVPPALLCLENPSFEGTPVPNLGQGDAFDAAPWSLCSNPAMPVASPNAPAIANETVSQLVSVPKAMDGTTYLALGEGQQVSQPFCSTIDEDASLSLELDLSRVDLQQVVGSNTEQVFLEIWGGLAVDCSQHELLWASPALAIGWKRYCVTLHPHSFLNQITLRANADMTSASPAYLLVDNLKPMDTCP
jgi:hypothetical protein